MQSSGWVLRQIPSATTTPLSLRSNTSKFTHEALESPLHSTMGQSGTECKGISKCSSSELSSIVTSPTMSTSSSDADGQVAMSSPDEYPLPVYPSILPTHIHIEACKNLTKAIGSNRKTHKPYHIITTGNTMS